LNASEHRLRKAYYWFYGHIKERFGQTENSGRNLASFLDDLVDKLIFTVITVTDELNAFKVFETLNARGVRLSSADLLKNYLFSLVSADKAHEIDLKKLEERWEHIVGLLGGDNFQEFLRVFWNSRHKLTRASELFKAIKKSVFDRAQAFELLLALDGSAEIYAEFRDPTKQVLNSEEMDAISRLRLFGVQQPLSMLLACYDKFFEKERAGFTRILKNVAIVSFRYNVIGNGPPNDQERLYNEVAVQVTTSVLVNPDEVIKSLKAVYPDDDSFKLAFSEKEIRTSHGRNKKIARYILAVIEKRNFGQDLNLDEDTYNLEHILPEHPSESWDYLDEGTQDRLIYRLGNMALLETNANRDIGNAYFPTKRLTYGRSAVNLTKAIAERYAEWTEQTIESRQKDLAKMATAIWRIDF
jgi:hypothetical protein